MTNLYSHVRRLGMVAVYAIRVDDQMERKRVSSQIIAIPEI